jgi:hypothetical protein
LATGDQIHGRQEDRVRAPETAERLKMNRALVS